MRNAFVRAVTKAAAADDRIMLLTGDVGYKVFDDFAAGFPSRFLNMGVSEANMVSTAAGLALEGMRPFTYSIVPFATVRCLEQIRNDVCNMELPVVITGVGAGFAYGENGPTHHGVDDVAALRAMPGMTVVGPADPREAEQAVSALIDNARPAYLRLGRAGEPVLPGTDAPFVLGRPKVLVEGAGVAVLACGGIASEALQAARILESDGVRALVLSVHTVKPITGLADMLRAREVRSVLTVEEHGPAGGLFEAVCAHLSVERDAPRIRGLHAPDAFFHVCGSRKALLEMLRLDTPSIVAAVKEALADQR